MSSKAVASLNSRIPRTPGSSRHQDQSLLSQSTRVRKEQLNGYMISGSDTDEHVQVRSVSHKSSVAKSVSTTQTSPSSEEVDTSEKTESIFKSSTADFSKSISQVATTTKRTESIIKGSKRSHLTAPRTSRLNARNVASPYARSPEKKRPILRQTKTELDEDDIENQPLPDVTSAGMAQSMQEGMVSTDLTPADKTPERSHDAPKTPKTWGNWLQSFSSAIPSSAKKALSAWTSRKNESGDDVASAIGKNLFPVPKKDPFGKKDDEASIEAGKKKKKRQSLPGDFEAAVNGVDTAEDLDEEPVKEKKKRETANPETYANPYILMQDYKPKIKGKAVTVSLLSRAPKGSALSVRTPPHSPAVRSIRGVSRAPGEAPAPRTPSRLASSFHPYNRSTPGRTPARKEKEEKPLTAEEELEQIRQRQRERAVQQEEDLYRERKLARMMGKSVPEVDPKELIGNQDVGTDTDEEPEQPIRSPKRKASTPAAIPVTPPQIKRVSKVRRGYGLFDSESEDEAPLPPKKKQNTGTSEFAPISLNKPSSASSAEPSPDSDKENAFFADPPPAPQPSHRELPNSSAPLAQKPAVPQTPVPAKVKAIAEKHKPAVPSSLRASTSANPSPPSAAAMKVPALKFGAKAIITSSINNISIENLFPFHFPPLPAQKHGLVARQVEQDWIPENKYVDMYMNMFTTGIAV